MIEPEPKSEMPVKTMQPDDGEKYIRENVEVTRQKVSVAMARMLANFREETLTMVEDLVQAMDAVMPNPVVRHQSIDPMPELKKTADAMSWHFAGWMAGGPRQDQRLQLTG